METGSPLWAHRGGGEPQSLLEHLTAVSRISAVLTEKLGLPLAGELIGLLHDLGKATVLFQEYLNGTPEFQAGLRGRIDHSTAGAQTLLRLLREEAGSEELAHLIAQWLGLCIVSHHGGLIDCLTPQGDDGLQKRLGKAETLPLEAEAWRSIDPAVRTRVTQIARDPQLMQECKAALARVVGSGTHGDRAVQLGLFTRMLFSCLIDADRTNTADHENSAAARHRQHRQYGDWLTLLGRISQHLHTMSSDGDVNRTRAQVSQECFAAGSRPRGAYTLTVPTGGGKTLAALRFALEHARVHSLERVVFVSPYISIVEQNAAVARAILEPEGALFGSVVLEHHSNLPTDTGKLPARDQWRARVLAENWDAPVVFTTMAQVLDAFFGAGTRAARRLHSLANTVLVFDEVQTLPTRAIHLFNNAINLLTSHCGATVLLCTATQPSLHRVDAASGAAHLAGQPELIADVPALFRSLQRYQVLDHTARPGGWTREQVAELTCTESAAHGSCLTVVNTKHDAQQIFKLCRANAPAGSLVLHLSTGMCPAHRMVVLSQLKQALDGASPHAPVICVSTQLIEAGVDIDFATVVRDFAGLDSLAQAAGRCNRHGRRAVPGRVHLVKLPDPPKQLEDILKGREVAEEVLGQWRGEHPDEPFPLDTPAQMQRFYEYAFHRRANEMDYPVTPKDSGREDTLLRLLGANGMAAHAAARQGHPVKRRSLLQSFKTANEAFQLIAPTQGIVCPFGTDGKNILAQLNAAFDLAAEWQLLRKAQLYTVSVYPQHFHRLQKAGAVYPVEGGTGVYCLRPEFYDDEYGLRSEAGFMEGLIA